MLERVAHEILAVETIITGSQTATARTHNTMYAHCTISAPATVAPGADLPITIALVRWDDQSPITDEDREIAITVDGQVVKAVATVNGVAEATLVLNDPGTYRIGASHPLTQGAELEVTVA
ncbi:MAG: hypothetical protein ACOY94_19530 [Bacillota bacterium]